MCFLPVMLLGYLLTMHPNNSHVTSFNDPVIQAQTCERGPGFDIKLTPAGLAALSAQYGFADVAGPWTLSLTPRVGAGLLPYEIPELTSRMNFSLGLQGSVGYDQGRLALEYWHMSNAGLGNTNAGIDMIAITTGFVLY